MPSSVGSAALLLALVVAVTGVSAPVAIILGSLAFIFELVLFLAAGFD